MGSVTQLTPQPLQLVPSFNLLPGLEDSPFKTTPLDVVLLMLSLMRANEIDTLRRTCRSFKCLADRPEVQRLVAIKLNLTSAVKHSPEILRSIINLKSEMNKLLCRLSQFYRIEGERKKVVHIRMQALRREESAITRKGRILEIKYRISRGLFIDQVKRRLLEDILKDMPPRTRVSLHSHWNFLTIVKDEKSVLRHFNRLDHSGEFYTSTSHQETFARNNIDFQNIELLQDGRCKRSACVCNTENYFTFVQTYSIQIRWEELLKKKEDALAEVLQREEKDPYYNHLMTPWSPTQAAIAIVSNFMGLHQNTLYFAAFTMEGSNFLIYNTPDKYAMVTEFKSFEELNEDEKYAIEVFQQVTLHGNQLKNLTFAEPTPPVIPLSTHPITTKNCIIS
jgi:hypothetical protein